MQSSVQLIIGKLHHSQLKLVQHSNGHTFILIFLTPPSRDLLKRIIFGYSDTAATIFLDSLAMRISRINFALRPTL